MNSPATYADGERVRLAHGLPERFIFMPNQFWPHKNHRLVVEALGRLASGGERPCIAASGLVNDARAPGLMQGLRDGLAASGAVDNFHFP